MTATAEQQPQPLEATDLRLWAFLDLDLPEDRSTVRLTYDDLATRAGYTGHRPRLYVALSRLSEAGWLELHTTRPRDPAAVTVSRLVPRGHGLTPTATAAPSAPPRILEDVTIGLLSEHDPHTWTLLAGTLTEDTWTRLSVAELALRTGYGRREALRSLSRLEGAGWLEASEATRTAWTLRLRTPQTAA